jgi:hypothetical protein
VLRHRGRARAPAEIREKIFQPTADVRLAHETVQVPMRGEDRNGYECPYFQVYVNGKGPFTFLFDTGSSTRSSATGWWSPRGRR